MSAPKISARVKHPNKTQTFVTTVQTTMDIFEDQIGSLSRDIRLKVYKTLVHSYKTALTTVWDSAQNANITLILETVQDKAMSELTEMAKKLQIPPPTVNVVKEKRDVPTLETITGLMLAKIPTQNVPNTAVCEKIGFIFSKLSEASKAYGEAAEALAQVSADVSPEHYMLLLSAAATPTIQIVVPQTMLSPAIAPPPPSPDTSTTPGRTVIINATKVKVLPNPNLPRFAECDDNTPTRVLAAAIYATIERKFFDTTHSRMELATTFKCNVSQLSKALTSVEYRSGPHYYKPKPKSVKKRTSELGEPSGMPPTKTSKPVTETMAKLQGANYARCFLPELCKPLPVSLFQNLCETVAYGACAVLWGMFVRGCARRDLC